MKKNTKANFKNNERTTFHTSQNVAQPIVDKMAVKGVDFTIDIKEWSGHNESEFTACHHGSKVLSLKGVPYVINGKTFAIKALDRVTKNEKFITVTFNDTEKSPEGFVIRHLLSTGSNDNINSKVASKHKIAHPIFIIFEKIEKQEVVGSPIKEIISRRSINIANIISVIDGQIVLA